MLTEQQVETIDYLVLGTMTIQEVANKVGCTSRVIYKWKKIDEFKAECDKRSHEFQTGIVKEANGLLVNKLGQAIANVIDIANDKDSSDKVRLDANFYIINRILGNTTTKIEQTSIDNTSDNNIADIDNMLSELDDSNVIELDSKVV